MIKILFVHHAAGWGGAPNSMIKLINSLNKSQYDVEVLLLKQSIVAEKLAENGIKHKVADSLFYRRYYQYFTHSEADYLKWYRVYSFLKLSILWLLSRYYFAKKELLKHDYDLVHLNSSVLTDWLAPAKAKGRVIIHIREPFRKGKIDVLYKFFASQMRKYADHIIAISNDNAKRVNIPYKTTVVYNYSNIEVLKELDIQKYCSKSVLYVGGVSQIKGFYTLVDALQFINDDIVVYFAGYYSSDLIYSQTNIKIRLKEILKKIILIRRSMALHNVAKSHKALKIGLISDINDYLDKSVCLVSPFSVPHFARPIIEAFARRKPAIGTKIDGMDEIIEDGRNGILVDSGNAKFLACAINYLCEHPLVAKKMGDNGYELAEKKYSPKNIEKIQNIYLKLIQNPEVSNLNISQGKNSKIY
jgi:glycosyltransferase involved in cell wall biosynthesis